MIKRTLSILILLLAAIIAQAQDYGNIQYFDQIYDHDITSVQLYSGVYQMGFPIFTLKSGEQLTLAFDDLQGEGRYFKYTFIHCSHDWKPDGMNQIEYLDGFQ